ncbi:hypothetical protein AAC387_Pa08g1438 [Persea americana]
MKQRMVSGGAACKCVVRVDGGRDGEMEKMREMEKVGGEDDGFLWWGEGDGEGDDDGSEFEDKGLNKVLHLLSTPADLKCTEPFKEQKVSIQKWLSRPASQPVSSVRQPQGSSVDRVHSNSSFRILCSYRTWGFSSPVHFHLIKLV